MKTQTLNQIHSRYQCNTDDGGQATAMAIEWVKSWGMCRWTHEACT